MINKQVHSSRLTETENRLKHRKQPEPRRVDFRWVVDKPLQRCYSFGPDDMWLRNKSIDSIERRQHWHPNGNGMGEQNFSISASEQQTWSDRLRNTRRKTQIIVPYRRLLQTTGVQMMKLWKPKPGTEGAKISKGPGITKYLKAGTQPRSHLSIILKDDQLSNPGNLMLSSVLLQRISLAHCWPCQVCHLVQVTKQSPGLWPSQCSGSSQLLSQHDGCCCPSTHTTDTYTTFTTWSLVPLEHPTIWETPICS